VNENAVVVANRMKADGSNPVTLAEFCGKLDQYVSSGSEEKIWAATGTHCAFDGFNWINKENNNNAPKTKSPILFQSPLGQVDMPLTGDSVKNIYCVASRFSKQ